MITVYKLFAYEIPLLIRKQKREGILLYLESKQGNSSWGEIAPLPGWNIETLQTALLELENLKEELLNKDLSFERMIDLLKTKELSPSVSFGVESALFSLHAPISLPSMPLSALLLGSYKEIQEQIPSLFENDYKSAKLKVSELTFKEAANIIDLLKDKVRLRIDVNRAWSLDESLSFFSSYPKNTFEYLEEPAQDPKDLFLFTHPIAVDETLREKSIDEIVKIPSLKSFIIKPTMQGGLSHCKPIADFARCHNKNVILSSSFETGVGLYQIASFFSRLSLPITALGFDTYRFLSSDVLRKPHQIEKGVLYFSPLEPNLELMKEITYV